eukprot:2580550-Pleurochrysis_carterae.AAC.3
MGARSDAGRTDTSGLSRPRFALLSSEPASASVTAGAPRLGGDSFAGPGAEVDARCAAAGWSLASSSASNDSFESVTSTQRESGEPVIRMLCGAVALTAVALAAAGGT